MRHAMRKYLTILLCAVLLLGVFCPAAAAGKPAEPTAPEEPAGIASDPAKTIYGVSDETTFVPAGYTFVYTGPNGETYTQVAEGDMFISPRILTTEEATALAALEYGNPKAWWQTTAPCCSRWRSIPRRPPSILRQWRQS